MQLEPLATTRLDHVCHHRLEGGEEGAQKSEGQTPSGETEKGHVGRLVLVRKGRS